MKKVFMILILVAAIFLAGCQQTEKSTNIGGVDMGFMTATPPISLRENDDFNIGIKLMNKALKEVTGKLCVFDTASPALGGIGVKDCREFTIAAAEEQNKKIIPETKIERFPEGGGAYSYHDVITDTTVNVLAELTYPFENTISGQICLKKNPDEEIKEFKCLSEETLSGNKLKAEIAPVTVSSIKKTITPSGNQNRVSLEITIKKSPTGEITSNEGGEDTHSMDVNVELVGTRSDFKCSPLTKEGKIKLTDNEKVINCESLVSLNQDYYQDTVRVILGYNYKTTISTGAIPLKAQSTGE